MDADMGCGPGTIAIEDSTEGDSQGSAIAVSASVGQMPPRPSPGEAPRHRIAIATPAYGGHVHADYCEALVRTVLGLQAAGHQVVWATNALSSIRAGRNDLASKVLAFRAVTHIMWIDADMSWEPGAVEKLLAHDLPVVSGIYPKKKDVLEWAAHLAMKEGGLLRMRGEHLLEAEGVGFGFVLVKREVFETIIKGHPERHLSRMRDKSSPLYPWTYDFFPDGLTGDGGIMGEDFGFCGLWRDLGGEIWLDTSIVLRHHGQYAFTADPAEALATGLARMKAEGKLVDVTSADRDGAPSPKASAKAVAQGDSAPHDIDERGAAVLEAAS